MTGQAQKLLQLNHPLPPPFLGFGAVTQTRAYLLNLEWATINDTDNTLEALLPLPADTIGEENRAINGNGRWSVAVPVKQQGNIELYGGGKSARHIWNQEAQIPFLVFLFPEAKYHRVETQWNLGGINSVEEYAKAVAIRDVSLDVPTGKNKILSEAGFLHRQGPGHDIRLASYRPPRTHGGYKDQECYFVGDRKNVPALIRGWLLLGSGSLLGIAGTKILDNNLRSWSGWLLVFGAAAPWILGYSLLRNGCHY